MRISIRSVAILICAALPLSCGGSTGVLVASAWDPGLTVDMLVVQTSVAGGAPASMTFKAPGGSGPMASPFRVLVSSPPDKSVEVGVQASEGGRVVATGRVSVTPGHAEILQLALELVPVADARCGDGTVDAGELCDDGNREDRDSCTNACTCARCGDGILQLFAGAASGSCQASVVEECDDGNTVSGDGCSADCKRE